VRYPAACGFGTSAINLHVIRPYDLDAAMAIGFRPVDGIDYDLRFCPGEEV
jgi:hypothetical protein